MSQSPRPPPTKSNIIDRRLPIYHEARIPPKRPNLVPQEEKSPTFSARSRPATSISVPMTIRSVSSPPPLPHLLRIRDLETGFDLSNDPQKLVSVNPETPANEQEVSSPASASYDNIPSTPAEETDATSQMQLRRKRSCIKRSSTGDFAKTVSWADDRELAGQVSKYASVAREAQSSGQSC